MIKSKSMKPGVFKAVKKDGTEYYRSSITHKKKHISLGSFSTEKEAFLCYKEASKILCSKGSIEKLLIKLKYLSFEKAVTLLNFRDNDIYIKTPVYLTPGLLCYYLSPEEVYIFAPEDLFYFSTHRIIKRGGHLYINDYGSQYNLLNRYGIKNYAVEGRDYEFANGDNHDFRYENIIIKSHYHGVRPISKDGILKYQTVLHLVGNHKIGTYSTEEKAAIAYNKACDFARDKGFKKEFIQNFVENVSPRDYAEIYSKVRLPKRFTEAFK